MNSADTKPRIIARLDIKGANVVKGICFDGLRVMGKPDELAARYYDQGADEILYIDTVASLYGRNNLLDVVRLAASHIFIPLTVGGGIRGVEDARKLLHSGADKIAINTAAVKTPGILREIALALGSQAVVLSMHIKRQSNGRFEAYVDNGRERTGLDAIEWALRAQDSGAGEILATSVDKDGTGKGFESDFMAELHSKLDIPLVAGGGAATPADAVDLYRKAKVEGIALASMLHYGKASIRNVKKAFSEAGISTANH
jgi:imidazole glycerol-phosphate synthase subunit HisF